MRGRWPMAEIFPRAVWVLMRRDVLGVHSGHKVRPHARGVRRHQPVPVAHRRLDDVRVLDRTVEVGIIECASEVRFRRTLVDVNAVLACLSERHGGQILVMTRAAALLRVPAPLAFLEETNAVFGGLVYGNAWYMLNKAQSIRRDHLNGC